MIRIRLFSRFEFCCDDGQRRDIEARKLQELLSYLLLNSNRPHLREMLAETLWGESSGTQSRKYLRQALWQLQEALDSQAGAAAILISDAEWVRIDPEADIWLDVADFERACVETEKVAGADLNEQQAQMLKEAADLYTGDLLETCYCDWCLFERERLQNMYLTLLDKLAVYCEAHGECEPGIKYGTRILRVDRARERAHRALMRLHYLAGDRTAALRQFARCAAALREELDVAPGSRTLALYELIRADRLDVLSAELYSVPGAAAPLADVLHRLEQLRCTLAEVEHGLQQDIRSVESALQQRR